MDQLPQMLDNLGAVSSFYTPYPCASRHSVCTKHFSANDSLFLQKYREPIALSIIISVTKTSLVLAYL